MKEVHSKSTEIRDSCYDISLICSLQHLLDMDVVQEQVQYYSQIGYNPVEIAK